MATEFQVNIDALTNSSRYLGSMGARIPEYGLRNIARRTLIDVFGEAVQEADYDGGFPSEFQRHTMDVVREFQDFYVINDGYSVFVSIDFDALGTQEDLRRAFHQGAKLDGGGNVWGPYNDEPLAAEDPEQAHMFWEAIRFGYDKAQLKNGKTMPTSKAPYQWDEVVNKYVEIWGSKAPEWLFIQYGQEEWNPYVPQIDIIGEFERRFFIEAEAWIYNFVYEEVKIAEAYATVGNEVGFTKTGQPRLLTGTFENPVTGKTIRPGQFTPRL